MNKLFETDWLFDILFRYILINEEKNTHLLNMIACLNKTTWSVSRNYIKYCISGNNDSGSPLFYDFEIYDNIDILLSEIPHFIYDNHKTSFYDMWNYNYTIYSVYSINEIVTHPINYLVVDKYFEPEDSSDCESYEDFISEEVESKTDISVCEKGYYSE